MVLDTVNVIEPTTMCDLVPHIHPGQDVKHPGFGKPLRTEMQHLRCNRLSFTLPLDSSYVRYC
jgi:hypothetical protein